MGCYRKHSRSNHKSRAWDRVREVEKSVSQGKKTKRGYTHPLSGFLFCADCGSKMKLNYINRNGAMDFNFNCGSHVRLGKAYCFSHHIAAKVLEKPPAMPGRLLFFLFCGIVILR